MSRRFQEHDQRSVTSLDGIWDFVFLGERDPDSTSPEEIFFDDCMAVPGCFDATPRYAGKRGLSAFRRNIYIEDDSPHRLIFNSVNHWCRILLDGKQVGDHAGGFTRFSFDIWDHNPGVHELVVLVDNRFDDARNPLHWDYFDWYQFGGITRGVALHRLGKTWIDGITITTEEIDPPVIRVDITYASIAQPGESQLQICWNERTILQEQINLNDASRTLTRKLRIPSASLRSPDSPNLHLLHVFLGDDDLRERVGLRIIRLEGNQILINDKPINLLGFNRHESHPQFGHSQPDILLTGDIQQLKDLGANFVRGSHYPQDQNFLDLCDESGICVWGEAIGWQHTAEHLNNSHFIDAQITHIDEMVRSTINRPSIIMWGLLNESHSHDERNLFAYRRLMDRIRETDPSRPVTYASCHPYDDLCFNLADIISINTYPGWYTGNLEEIPGILDGILTHIDQHHSKIKPVIISEIGAGAIPGWRDDHMARWTEQYQAKLLEIVIRHLFIERQKVAGLSIWLFNDFRTIATVMRPRGYNNKGVVDEYRRPKTAYQVVKNLFQLLKHR